MATLSALQGFIVIGIIIGIGYLAAASKICDKDAQMALQRFSFFISTPCLMFSIISKEHLLDVFTTGTLVALGSAVITGIAFLLCARFIFKLSLAESTIGTLVSMYMNSNNIGLPVATYILGNPAAVTVIVIMQQVLFTPIALMALDSASHGKTSVLAALAQLPRQPILVGVFCGVIVSAVNMQTGVFIVPEFIYDPINIVGQSAVPLILAAFGMSLKGSRIFEEKQDKRATITAASFKCLLMPLAAFLLAKALGLTGADLYACVVLAALPTAQNIFNYAARYQTAMPMARDGVLLSTLASPIVILVIATLLA